MMSLALIKLDKMTHALQINIDMGPVGPGSVGRKQEKVL